MQANEIEIRVFDPATATEQEWAAVLPVRQRLRAERMPDDPPVTMEALQGELRNQPSFIDVRIWVGRHDATGTAVAYGVVLTVRMEENQHLAQMDIGVLPEWRRRGLGRRLLAQLAASAAQTNRRVIVASTFDSVPSGVAFMTRIGGRVGMTSRVNQLDMATLDPGLLATWQDQAGDRAAGFTLGLWEGPYPESDLAAMVAIKEVMNQAPRGDLDVEDFHLTPEHLRQIETMMAQRGHERWTMYIREAATGALAGYTEVVWNPNKPEILHQEDTAVLPAYRGHGLGRWLKAAMLAKVMRERPGVRWVRTENATSNAPMLKINEELGFRPYKAESVWQVDLAQVQAYLAQTPAVAL